jgi:hypothetical protein
MFDYRRVFNLDIRFIEHFNTKLVTTSNYGTTADFHNFQIIRDHAVFSSLRCFHQ